MERFKIVELENIEVLGKLLIIGIYILISNKEKNIYF